MSKNHWHKRYHGDALNGCMGLTLEQRGAYNTILDLLYDSDWAIGIPDNDRWIAGHMNVSVRKWEAIKSALIGAGKIDLVDGKISNSRYRKERENALKKSRVCSENGASGGRKSAETRRKPAENCETGEANASDLLLYARAIELEAREDKKEKPVLGRTVDAGAKDDEPEQVRYAFFGKTVRLVQKDLDAWRKRYSAIPDIMAELGSLDDWFQRQPEAKRKNWFHTVSGSLNRKHQANLQAQDDSQEEWSFQGPC